MDRVRDHPLNSDVMKSAGIIFLMCVSGAVTASAQILQSDSLKNLLINATSDTARVLLQSQLAFTYRFTDPGLAVTMGEEALQLARTIHFAKGEIAALNTIGESLRAEGDLPKALEAVFEALRISKDNNRKEGEAISLVYIGLVYMDMSAYREALAYLELGNKMHEDLNANRLVSFGLSNIGSIYEKMGKLDSALLFQQKAYDLAKKDSSLSLSSMVLTRLGVSTARLGNYKDALKYYQESLQNTYLSGDMSNRTSTQYRIAELYYNLNRLDSGLRYARQTFASSERVFPKTALDASRLLSKLHRKEGRFDSALHYQELATSINDSLLGPGKFQQLQLLISTEQQRQQELLQEKDQLQDRYRLIALLSALGVFLMIAILLWRNNRKQQEKNRRLNEQKEKISLQRNDLEKTLADLKTTQSQLIQSEKMASLGELTAGIAHEIQNPLNFVNNFSEVNKELLAEMKGEIDKENLAEVKAIVNDIIDNEEKINQHGKRADAIVKGMLQHSRSSSGVKEPTDINKLTDEYLRLAYHGLRAKDTSFNTTLKTDYDEGIGNISIIPQDIGRVILNLINNAFYAVTEKKKQSGADYEPIVSICTKKINNNIEISVKDNGTGIPQKVVDKVFQPFFTTKPTGQGTGLGLSLSYDIIKAHGGVIRAETHGSEGAEFKIELPV